MRPEFVLLVPLFAFTSALAAPPSERPAEIATATASARRAARLVIDASTARRSPPKPRIVEIVDGVPRVRLDGPVPAHGRMIPNRDRDVWYAPIDRRSFDGAVGGERLAVTALDGTVVACTLSRIDVLNRGANLDGFDDGADAPTCGSDEVWGMLVCDQPTVGGVAVAADDETPAVWVSAGAAPGPAADAAMDRLWEAGPWQAAMADARAANGAEIRENVGVTAWSGASGVVYAVEAVVYTGEGYTICGGEDVNTHVVGVVGADGSVIVPFFVLSDVLDTDTTAVVGMIDVDKDGIPEVWTGALGFDGRVSAIGKIGTVLEVTHPWCGCPC